MRRDDLARQAMTILIGIPSCTVLIFVCSFLAPLLALYVAPVMGLVMLAPILAAGIAMIVFAVMHVSLVQGWVGSEKLNGRVLSVLVSLGRFSDGKTALLLDIEPAL